MTKNKKTFSDCSNLLQNMEEHLKAKKAIEAH